MALSIRQAALKHGWRSGLEEVNANKLKAKGVSFKYEALTLQYSIAETRKYTPDFLLPNGIIVETKGRWVTADRKKLKLIKEQHPRLDIRLVFSNPRARISKTSKTTYAKYAEDHGFPWAAKVIPDAWLTEKNPTARLEVERLLRGAAPEKEEKWVSR